MKTRRIFYLLLSLFVPLIVIGLVGCTLGTIKPEYTYQGRLSTNTGGPVADGNYTFRYRLFHTLTGGSPVYTETKAVAVKNGLFDSAVGVSGNINPDVFTQPTYMEVAVNGEVLTPRQRLEGAPFAFSLVPGANVQGFVPITRTVGTHANTGAALSIWNRDASVTGGNGLIAFNSAAPAGVNRGSVAALQAIAMGGNAPAGTGAYGAIIRSDYYRGAYVKGATNYYASVFDSNVGIQLIGGGTCAGCTLAYVAQNAGTEAIQVGDFVAVGGVVVDPDLKLPVMQVHKATGAAEPVVGVAGGAVQREPVGDFYGTTTGGFNPAGGPADAGQYLSVVVQGLVQARVGTASSLKIGDWISLESGQIIAAASDSARLARLASEVDTNGLAWIMFNGQ